MKHTLKGIIPPVVTPLHADGSLHEADYRKVIRHLLGHGVHGLFALGSTSEVVFLNPRERQRVLETTVEEVDGKVPVLAGVMDPATDRVIENAEQARRIGVDALVVTAPFYTRTNEGEIADHFMAVREAVDRPVMAYDIPVCVHSKLSRGLLIKLFEQGAIVGVKDSSGDELNFRLLLRETRELSGFSAFTGSEQMADAALLCGAHGCVPGLGNVDPAGYVRLYEAARRGDFAAAHGEQERLISLFELAYQALPRASAGASGVGGFKAAMQLMGLISTPTLRRPCRTLNDGEIDRVRRILIEQGFELRPSAGGDAA